MKITYNYFGNLEIEAEDDRDRLWLRDFLKYTPKEDREFLSRFIVVDMESMCVSEKKFSNGEHIPMVEVDIESVMDKKGEDTWGIIEKITISPMGDYN